MKLCKKTTLSLLLMIVLINILIRYPRVPHEVGADSFLIHNYATTIMDFGHIPWIRHPMSYIGLYPNSYPAGGPVLLASFSGISGLSMENTILLISGLLGVFSCIGAFMFAGTIIPDDRFKLIVAFGYSTSPLLLKYSMWTFSTRIIFMSFLPLFLWAVCHKLDLRIEYKPNNIIVAFLFILIIAATHRLFWMALIFGLTIIYFHMLIKGEKLKALHFLPNNIKRLTIYVFMAISFCLACILAGLILAPSITDSLIGDSVASANPAIFFISVFMAIVNLIFLYAVRREGKFRTMSGISMSLFLVSLFLIQYTTLASYRSSWFIRQIAPGFVDISSMLGEMIALGVVIGARYGLFMIFGTLGFLYLITRKRIDAKEFSVFMAILIFIPFIHLAMYFFESLFLLSTIMAGIFLIAFLHDHLNTFTQPKRTTAIIRRYGSVMVIVLLASSLLFAIYTTEYRFSNVDEDTGFGNAMTVDTYNAGLFSRDYNLNVTGGTFILRVNAISEQPHAIVYTRILWESGSELPSLSDINGWYNFLKNPYGSAETYNPPAEWPVYAGNINSINNINSVQYILFESSDTCLIMVNEW